MTDLSPLVNAGAAVLLALAAAIPTIVVVWQHRTTRAAVAGNTKQLGRIESQTNGKLGDLEAAVRSLRAEVVRQAAIIEALHAKGISAPKEESEQA